MGFLSPPHIRLEDVGRTFISMHGYLCFYKQGVTKEFSLSLYSHMSGPLKCLHRNF